MSDKSRVKEEWRERYPRANPTPDRTVTPGPGAIVQSKAGRDRFRRFLVTDIIESADPTPRAAVVNGTTRSTDHPKIKSLSHLIPVGMSDEAKSLIEKGALTDADVRRILAKS